jgi:hypothetical protein
MLEVVGAILRGDVTNVRAAPSPECTIKGNVNRSGERIYHMQNQRFYARIRMDKGGGK